MGVLPAGYKLLKEQSASTCKLFYVSRFGRRYLLKQYNKYRFPSKESIESGLKDVLKAQAHAQSFYDHLVAVMKLMRKHCREGGLINLPLDVFRRGNFIYKVTRTLKPCGIETDKLHEKLTPAQMDVLLRTMLTQLDQLRRMNYVHGDIKQENFVVQKQGRYYTASLIDYETGFVIGEPPDGYAVEYTPETAAPEMIRYQCTRYGVNPDEAKEAFAALTCAADIFAAGCVMANVLTGKWLGEHIGDRFFSPTELIKKEQPLWIPECRPLWRVLLREMTRCNPGDRPDAAALLQTLAFADEAGWTRGQDHPFAALSEAYRLEPEQRVLGGERMRLGARLRAGKGLFARKNRPGPTCMLWDLGGCWLGRRSGEALPTAILREQEKRAQRRLNALETALPRLALAAVGTGALAPARIVEYGGAIFLEQPLPGVNWRCLSALEEGLPVEEADRLFEELFAAVAALHAQGLLNCAVTADDVLLYRAGDGREHLFLARPQRLVLADSVPEPDDFDLPADCLAPEIALYMGTQDQELRDSLRELIGAWSDIFSMGLIYHRLLTGRAPQMDANCPYPGYAAQMDGLRIDSQIDERRRGILKCMLPFQPADRPETLEDLRAIMDPSCSRKEEERPGNAAARNDESQPYEDEWELDIDAEGWESAGDDEAPQNAPGGAKGGPTREGENPDEGIILEGKMAEIWIDDEPWDGDASESGEPSVGETWRLDDAPPVGRLCRAREAGGTRVRFVCPDPGMTEGELEKAAEIAGRCDALIGLDSIAAIGDEQWIVLDADPDACRAFPERLPIAGEQAEEIFAKLLEAAQAFHDCGAVCGPILPDNLLVRGDRLLINGFETAALSGGANARWRKRVGDIPGIRDWLAPEVLPLLGGGEGAMTPASDIYSLGLIFHWLLSGKLPEATGEDGPGIDPALAFAERWLIGRMLCRDPLRRPRSCEAIARELAELAEKRTHSHSVTVKVDGSPAQDCEAKLFARTEDGDVFVGMARTDRQGRAHFHGALPALDYYVLCSGQRVNCRWRNL